MMADLPDDGLPAATSPAQARSIPARDRPAPKAPIWRKVRRSMPSQ